MKASLTPPWPTPKPGRGVARSLIFVFLLFALAVGRSSVQGTLPDCPPTIVAQPLTIQRCETLTEVVIAQVFTGEDPDGSLEVELTATPPGLTISDLYNYDGNVLATVSADCEAEIGTVSISLRVFNFDEESATAEAMARIEGETTEWPEIADHNPGIGSILIYNLTTSSLVDPSRQDTRINITNMHSRRSVSVHLFWVDGGTGLVANSVICLTPNQTQSMLVSDLDPGVTGFLVAMAIDGGTGLPIAFNHLLGDEQVKLESGHEADLRAEAVKAGESTPPAIQRGLVEAEILFDGVHYQQLPRTLAISSLPSIDAGNQTVLIVNRVSGNFSSQLDSLGGMYGIVYDDLGTAYGFCARKDASQFISSLGAAFPRTGLRISDIIPGDRTGWMKIWATDDAPILGAVMNYHPEGSSNSRAFIQGRPLHKMMQGSLARWIVPIYPAGC